MQQRAIATRVISVILSFGAAYALTWSLTATSAGAWQHGRREQLSPRQQPFTKFGFSICEYWGVEKIPADIVARTPYRNAAALDSYLKKNMRGFEALRRELNPFILQALTDARRCFEKRGFADGPEGKIEWHVASDAAFARATNFRIYELKGGDDESRAAARSCLEAALEKRTFEAAKTAENGAFFEYDGLYPGFIPIFSLPTYIPRQAKTKNPAESTRRQIEGDPLSDVAVSSRLVSGAGPA